jgi:hypothetical protein
MLTTSSDLGAQAHQLLMMVCVMQMAFIRVDRHIKLTEIVWELNILLGSAQSIIQNQLDYQNVCRLSAEEPYMWSQSLLSLFRAFDTLH